MNLKKLGLAGLLSTALVGGVNAQDSETIQNPYPTVIIIQIFQDSQFNKNPNDSSRELMTIKPGAPGEINFNLKYVEPGYYRTIIEKKEGLYVLGGLENKFKMEVATPGYIIPNKKQITSFYIPLDGIYDIYVSGESKSLKLGRVILNRGDKVRFEKINIVRTEYYH